MKNSAGLVRARPYSQISRALILHTDPSQSTNPIAAYIRPGRRDCFAPHLSSLRSRTSDSQNRYSFMLVKALTADLGGRRRDSV